MGDKSERGRVDAYVCPIVSHPRILFLQIHELIHERTTAHVR